MREFLLFIHTLFHPDHNWYVDLDNGGTYCACGYLQGDLKVKGEDNHATL